MPVSTAALPLPGQPVLADPVAGGLPPRHYPAQPALSAFPPQSGEFYSTTTAPVRDHEQLPHADWRARKQSGGAASSSTARSSVLDRPRPRATQPFVDQQRPSSFFGVEGDVHVPARDVQDAGLAARGPGVAAVGAADGESDHEGRPGRASSFFGVDAPAGLVSGPSHGYPDAALPPVEAGSAHHARRSSFYGLDAHATASGTYPQRQSSLEPASAGRDGNSPAVRTPSSQSHSHLPLDRRPGATGDRSSGSGSGSYSSHDAPHRGARYAHTPYAASRSASLYGASSASLHGQDPSPPPPAQLLDQSHLQVGTMASLLSHEKTLELYRQNAKKTNDPDIQYEFCTFVMDVVADLEQATLAERAARGAEPDGSAGNAPPTPQEIEARHKQQALVSESIALLSKLATRGHVKSSYFLADCYTQGIGTPKGKRDYDKAFPLFLVAGKHGHAAGSYRAAQCMEHGWGTRKDWSKAVSFYRRAAVLSHVQAMHRLGLAELNGELGLTKRAKDGVQWLTRAAELADQVEPPQPQSLHELAILHEKGIENVVFQDEEYAAELLARAAELQYAPSAYKLGECYEYGKMGCPQDAALSIHYYNIAAQQNHPAACFALTAWYLVGSPGILPQSDTEAYLWAKKAAGGGLAKAEYACGYFTEVGIGTYKDERDALEWFRKAAAHGDKRAMERLRIAGHAVPPPEKPVARKASPVAAPDAPVSALHLPERPRRLSTHKMLRKENSSLTLGGSLGRRDGKQRTASVDVLSSAVRPAPERKNKGKGKEKALPHAPENGAMPPHPGMAPRQRSYSQPSLAHSPLQPLDYNLRPAAPQSAVVGDFGPLAYDHRVPATVAGRPSQLQPAYAGEYGAGYGHHQQQQSAPVSPAGFAQAQYQHQLQVQQQQAAAAASARGLVVPQPDEMRMPLRQQVGGSPVLGSDEVAHKRQEREKVLQRRKNPGEDKDCVVM
ncbi:hypothetical protein Rhopal_000118-T1 [Rhodotorula paludigena]|uniref:HCP-like protein n=1 Tax=Rhodotorula paludigena TaxID=86838 RepID=A0AAV5GEV3_9BASI|nr:hypothetical protein Rhopal_000118-T1 [Rhodotorula paludigena]